MLGTKNERIIAFYKTHKEFDFDKMNILLIELLEKITNNKDINREDILLSSFKNIEAQVTNMDEKIKLSSQNIMNMQTTLASIPVNFTDNLSTKLLSIKDNSVKDIERVLDLNKQNTTEHFDFKMKSVVLETFKNILDTNMIELKDIVNTRNSPREFIDSINVNFQSRCDALQQILLTQFNSIKETNSSHTETLDVVKTHFERQKNSNYKGIDSEDKIEIGLNNTFPDAIITNTTGPSQSGDFWIERVDKSKIMIENKHHSSNVSIPDIEKFIRDANYQACHSILISQTSGISRKQNFQIDFHNGCILIYIHYMNYDFDKLKLAVDAIDHLSIALKEYGGDSIELKISPEAIKEINNEYQRFIIQKNGLSETLKLFNRDMTKQLCQIDFPELSKILSQQFTSTEETLFKCEYCKVKVYKNAKALAAHVRKCKVDSKKQNMCIAINTKENNIESDDDIDN